MAIGLLIASWPVYQVVPRELRLRFKMEGNPSVLTLSYHQDGDVLHQVTWRDARGFRSWLRHEVRLIPGKYRVEVQASGFLESADTTVRNSSADRLARYRSYVEVPQEGMVTLRLQPVP